MKTTCEIALNAILIGFGTWFWLWFLVEEGLKAKGMRPLRWYDRQIKLTPRSKKDENEVI